jgi:putative flavoprotein involved in K+ transport
VPVEKVETLIVGGGQAGLMMSAQLRQRGRSHLILERHGIAERWRTERWDALHANGPAWHDRFPDLPIAGVDSDGFASRDQMADYFTAYAAHIAAPIRCGVVVTALHRKPDGTGFHAETSAGPIEATNVVAATGPFQRGIIPPLVPPLCFNCFDIEKSYIYGPENPKLTTPGRVGGGMGVHCRMGPITDANPIGWTIRTLGE